MNNEHSMLVFVLAVCGSSVFTPALLRTQSFVFIAVRESRRIFLSPFVSHHIVLIRRELTHNVHKSSKTPTRQDFQAMYALKAFRRVSSFFLGVQLLQSYVATGHTSAFISRNYLR